MKKVFIAAFGVICLHDATAANWQFAMMANSGKTLFSYDSSSIAPVSKDIKKMWVKGFASEDEVIPYDKTKKYSSELNLWYFDCSAKKYSVVSAIYYDKDGNTVDSFQGKFSSSQLSDVAPETLGEVLLNKACVVAKK